MGMGFKSQLDFGLVVEPTLLSISMINHDPFNKGMTNRSIASCGISLLSTSLALIGRTTMSDSLQDKYPVWWIPVLLTNSTYYFPIMLHEDAPLRIAPFMNIETEYFMYRPKKWAQISPGAGIGIILGKRNSILEISSGFERTFQSDFHGKSGSQNLYFMRFSLYFGVGV
ncbi:MAG TPA: hypothetical protein PLE74_02770 [Candidatus Cloacimonadota bacterium]|nr:hypothetical protein [Candidatus Cloacimonadota bacterium]HPT71187.1 hypothetical protein [Candidatus Cloacimonadota bacterium]